MCFEARLLRFVWCDQGPLLLMYHGEKHTDSRTHHVGARLRAVPLLLLRRERVALHVGQHGVDVATSRRVGCGGGGIQATIAVATHSHPQHACAQLAAVVLAAAADREVVAGLPGGRARPASPQSQGEAGGTDH